jgi:hypothetical protein
MTDPWQARFKRNRIGRDASLHHSSTEPLRVVIFYVSDLDTPFLDQYTNQDLAGISAA